VQGALLEANFLPEKCKDWFHPAFSNDDPLKQRTFTWNTWAQVETLAAVMLDNLTAQISAKGEIDLTQISKTPRTI
jgi:hypothetical protein